jgi:isoquinoline 1-oxidoreductase beta subunit
MIVADKMAARKNDGVSRRALLTGGLAGGFLLAFHLPLRAAVINEPVQPPDVTAGKFAPNAFIRIEETGRTTLIMPQVEMGQGVYTSIAWYSPKSSTPISRRWRSCTRRRTTSSTPTRSSACR